MVNNATKHFKNNLTSKIVFYGTIGVFIFWILSRVINIYKYVFVGVIFEILWLPAIVAVFILPLLSLWFLAKENFSVKSLYLYAIIVSVINFLLMYLNK